MSGSTASHATVVQSENFLISGSDTITMKNACNVFKLSNFHCPHLLKPIINYLIILVLSYIVSAEY